MAELTYELPIVGKPDKTQDPKVTEALEKIKKWANGEIGVANIKNGEVTKAKLSSEVQTKLGEGPGNRLVCSETTAYFGNGAAAVNEEREAVSPYNLKPTLTLAEITFTAASEATFFVGGIEIGKCESQAETITRMQTTFLVPPKAKWKWTGTASSVLIRYLPL